MRFLFPVAVVVLLLVFGSVGPAYARGGKGGGGGGGHVSRGGGQRSPGGGQSGDWKHQDSQSQREKDSWDQSAKEKTAKDKATRSAKAKTGAESPDGDRVDAVEAGNKKEKQLANFQQQRDKKMAQAEHLRQIAERNGNANLAANADRMEAQAHEQYAQKVSHLEKFGVTDPELEPSGDGPPTSPSVPRTGPFADPRGTLRGLLPFGR